MHQSSYQKMEAFVSKYLDPKQPLAIADIGSWGDWNYRPLFSNAAWQYTGFDRQPGDNVDALLEGEYDWPNVPPEAFDVVISGQTLEHTRHPWLFVKSLHRILKPGALCCVIAPYEWDYHAYPIDCWRVYPDGMRAVLEWAGLTVLEVYGNNKDTVGIARK